MTTNIIRQHLIQYTAEQCQQWGIPTRRGATGFYWNGGNRSWESGESDNLYIGDRRILLTPKSVVSHCKQYAPSKYHQHFLLTFLQHEHLRLGTNLVQTRVRKDGSEVRFVTKKSLIADGGAAFDKDYLATFTLAHPEVFDDFKTSERTRESSVPLEELMSDDIARICEHLEAKLGAVPVGTENATAYHRVAVSIMDFLCYPKLSKPKVEERIHGGRKRVDVTFDNGASSGFFATLANQAQLPCRYIFCECKNYGRDVANPEIDQLSGRFSFNTGRVGILLCRGVQDRDLLLARCRDTLRDDRGLILPLTDADLITGLRQRAQGDAAPLEGVLQELHRAIALRG